MVFVNDKKFACESCIKGHRSSSCQHTDRPLFEIKKKGRPVSQCEKCRELRKTKRMHSKCTCASSSSASEPGPSAEALASSADAAGPPVPNAKSKSRRFKPIAPALPNGLKDILPLAGPSSNAMHLCRCGGKNPSICTCGHDRAAPLPSSGNGGLAALAQAAMFCCGNDLPSAEAALPVQSTPVVMTANTQSTASVVEEATRKHPRGCCSSLPSSRPPSPQPKRPKHISHNHTPSTSIPDYTNAFSIPALHSPEVPPPPLPEFPPIPPLSTIVSYAAPECCCGTACACPGCVTHRGEAHASASEFEDCSEGSCGTCVDHDAGPALPAAAFAASQGGLAGVPAPTAATTPSLSAAHADEGRSTGTGTSFIDAFFARAAALPPPPPPRTAVRPGTLDGTDVRVYPRGLFARDAPGPADGRRAAFGLVAVPKLECSCPGGCGCPEDRCACGESCAGCGPGLGLELEEAGEPDGRKGEEVREGGPGRAQSDKGGVVRTRTSGRGCCG